MKLGKDIGMTRFQCFGLGDVDKAIEAVASTKSYGSEVPSNIIK